MTEKRTDIVSLLEKEREYHLDQVKRINIALQALTGTVTTDKPCQPKAHNIGWAASIENLFDQTSEWLDLQQIRDKLAENGLPEALDDKNRNTIYSTLIRKVNKTKTLEKDEKGRYRRRQKVTGKRKRNEIQETTATKQ